MAKQKVASELTALQRELLQALVESGISKDSLLRACSALFTVKQEPESGEAAQLKTSSEAQHANEHSRGSTPQQNTPIKNTGNEELHGRDTHAEGQQPITFLDQMLRMDPWQAAKLVKMYMQQHNIPQREVVESTGLNQSHLSQHLNKGTPMKTNKRAVLYTWFENKRKEVVEQYTTPGKRPVPGIGASSASSSKKPRRNRFKWGPASTGILYQSYEEQKNPSKDEREALVVACNRAECNQRGVPYHNVEGLGPNLVTESRVYNWFANRRKEETFRMKLAIDAANYSETSVTPTAGQVAVSQALMSQNTNTVMSPMMDHGTSMPATPKAAIPQSGLPCPAMPSVPVTTEMQHPSLAQHMMQPIGTHAGQHQEMQMVGNFVSAMHHQQMPLGMAMMPHPGVPVSTCQVAVQPQMIPVSSMAQHQQPPMVPGMGQMPVIVSVQPGIPDGMQHHPENLAQMTGAAPFVQMHHVPITTLPMPPPLQPITCNDMTLPPPLQPLTVVSPMVQMAPRPSIQVGTPSNIRNQITPQVEPQCPVYDVKLDTPSKDVIVERTDSTTIMSSPEKPKNESKSDVIEVENGDDETVIAETITVITLAEDLNSECAETSDDDKKGNIKHGGTKDLSKSIAVSLSNTSSQEQSSCQSNGKS